MGRPPSGREQIHLVAVLDHGAAYQPLSVNAKDAQFLEQRAFGVRSIARLSGCRRT